jgi:hypothetical protein
MFKCETCLHGRNIFVPDPQIRGDMSKRSLDSWECGHPNEQVRKLALQKGWPETCQEYCPK